MLTGLTNYLWGGALALVLAVFAYQEIKLHVEIAATSAELVAEIQCLKGSHCAGALLAESARGAELVAQEREAAATALAAQKAEVDKQAADAVLALARAQADGKRSLADALAGYQKALQTPACEVWSKQVNSCATK
jgi:hypothetical protein